MNNLIRALFGLGKDSIELLLVEPGRWTYKRTQDVHQRLSYVFLSLIGMIIIGWLFNAFGSNVFPSANETWLVIAIAGLVGFIYVVQTETWKSAFIKLGYLVLALCGLYILDAVATHINLIFLFMWAIMALIIGLSPPLLSLSAAIGLAEGTLADTDKTQAVLRQIKRLWNVDIIAIFIGVFIFFILATYDFSLSPGSFWVTAAIALVLGLALYLIWRRFAKVATGIVVLVAISGGIIQVMPDEYRMTYLGSYFFNPTTEREIIAAEGARKYHDVSGKIDASQMKSIINSTLDKDILPTGEDLKAFEKILEKAKKNSSYPSKITTGIKDASITMVSSNGDAIKSQWEIDAVVFPFKLNSWHTDHAGMMGEWADTGEVYLGVLPASCTYRHNRTVGTYPIVWRSSRNATINVAVGVPDYFSNGVKRSDLNLPFPDDTYGIGKVRFGTDHFGRSEEFMSNKLKEVYFEVNIGRDPDNYGKGSPPYKFTRENYLHVYLDKKCAKNTLALN